MVKDQEPLVKLCGVSRHYRLAKDKVLKAVDQVSLSIYPGEVLGVVGESGCGKSTLGRVIARMEPPTQGSVYYKGVQVSAAAHQEGQNKAAATSRQAQKAYCKNVQVIFQDPYSALNPRHTAGRAIARGLEVHGLYKGKERERLQALLQMVGLPEDSMDRYPHEFSGGQRQRICIARALAVEPAFLICDEPLSALDVSIQSQIVNLLLSMKETFGLTMLFISHDLSVVKYICDRVLVMYLGTVVEVASSEEIYANPLHFYTQALLSAVPIADPEVERTRQRILLSGDLPSPVDAPKGCTFCSRCPYSDSLCQASRPKLQEVSPGHKVACHHLDRVSAEKGKEAKVC